MRHFGRGRRGRAGDRRGVRRAGVEPRRQLGRGRAVRGPLRAARRGPVARDEPRRSAPPRRERAGDGDGGGRAQPALRDAAAGRRRAGRDVGLEHDRSNRHGTGGIGGNGGSGGGRASHLRDRGVPGDGGAHRRGLEQSADGRALGLARPLLLPRLAHGAGARNSGRNPRRPQATGVAAFSGHRENGPRWAACWTGSAGW